MKGFYFDLVALPRRVIWLRALLLLLGASALLGTLAYWHFVMGPELALQRQQVQTAMSALGRSQPVASLSPKDLAQAWQRAQGASEQLGLPWENFFAQLGRASAGGDVAFVSIEPDAQKGRVVLVAEARTLAAMLQFIRALQASADFSEVQLQSHTINKMVPEQPVRMRVSATWRMRE